VKQIGLMIKRFPLTFYLYGVRDVTTRESFI